MKKFLKYGVFPFVIFLFLFFATVMVLPVVINVQKFVPEIETQLSNVTGRPVTIGSDLGLSFFPWLSISFSDLKVANPEGYLSDNLIKIKSFEARLKLLPLFRKEVQVNRFIIGGLEVNLEKNSDGMGNWQSSGNNNPGQPSAAPTSSLAGWSLPKGLAVKLFAVTDGTLTWLDRTNHHQKRFDDLMLLFHDFTLENPVAVEFKASVDGKQLEGEGTVGPFGPQPGLGVLPVDLAINIGNSFSVQLKGTGTNLLENPGYDLEVHAPPFSARELCDAFGVDFPLNTTDPSTFRSVSVDVRAKGDTTRMSIEKGQMKVDDSLLDISLSVKNFVHPELDFALAVDQLDLDRYLAPAGQDVADFVPWQKTNLTGELQVGEVTVGGKTFNDLDLHLRGADEIFAVDLATFTIYQGRGQATMALNFQDKIPETNIDLKLADVQAGPLLHDLLNLDFLSGAVEGDTHLLFSGSHAEEIKKSLNGTGNLRIRDGAFEGIDMVQPKRNILAMSFDSDTSDQQVRTAFSEVKSNFSIRNGVVEIHDTRLTAPGAGIHLSGTADLVGEKLKVAIEPDIAVQKITMRPNEKDAVKNSIPFAISGTFIKPKIDIDAKYLSLEELNLSEEPDMQNLVEENLSASSGEDVGSPAVVTQHLGLEPLALLKSQAKKQLKVGAGRIRVNPLRVEENRQ